MSTFQARKCQFCEGDIKHIDYKNTHAIRKYLTQYYKIVPKYYSGNCLKHQKRLAQAVKRARTMALMPFTR